MDQDARFAARLTRLGLTTYEAKAYLALIRRDAFTAAQVARQAGLPRQRIYDVLSSLVQKGLASARPGTLVKYAPTAPEVALDLLIASHRRQLAEMEQDARSMIGALSPAFEAGQAHSEPLDYIEVLRDRRSIDERLAELQAGVEQEVLVFAKPPYAKQPQQNGAGVTLRRGLRARSIYELAALNDQAATEAVRLSLESGEDARFVPELPLKLVIIDEAIVMLGMEDPLAGGNNLTGVVIEHHSLARVLRTAFEASWQAGLSLEQGRELVGTSDTGGAVKRQADGASP